MKTHQSSPSSSSGTHLNLDIILVSGDIFITDSDNREQVIKDKPTTDFYFVKVLFRTRLW